MKDLYAFSRDEEELQAFYNRATAAYLRVFDKVGLGDNTYLTYASGGSFTQFSHEFQTITEAGEDTIYINRAKKRAINKEAYTDAVLAQLGLQKNELEEVKAAEVGNIFNFGSTKAEQLGLYFNDQSGADKPVFLSSYGMGITRLMGVITEHFADDKGLVWPDAVAPAQVHLVRIGDKPDVIKQADELYNRLTASDIQVLYDDRDVRAGEKFADADLLGIPHRVVVSDKTVDGGTYEWKRRTAQAAEQVSTEQLLKTLGIDAKALL
jgi:prolyl-tRNA synthetase